VKPSSLSRDELALASAASPDEVERFAELGLIRRQPTGGPFDTGDVSRLRLLLALTQSGVPAEELASAERSGKFSLDFAGELLADSPGLTGRTVREALLEVGLERGFARSIQQAIGLPLAEDETLIREDDRELFAIASQARQAGVGDEALLQLFRVFAISIRHLVEAQRDLYRQNVEDPLIEAGLSRLDVLRRTAGTRLRLQRLGYRAVFLLMRRFLEQTVFENVFARIDEALVEAGIGRASHDADRAVVFIDLAGFTRLTEEEGDAAAARRGGQLVALVLDACARHGGRLVKALGDGAMLHFRSVPAAIRVASEVVDPAAAPDLPPRRAGIAAGPVVTRDGDLFGRTVNLAARIAAVTPPGEVWASESAVAATTGSRPGFGFEDRGERALKGLSGATRLWAVVPHPEEAPAQEN
jgi:adenylate cyclase